MVMHSIDRKLFDESILESSDDRLSTTQKSTIIRYYKGIIKAQKYLDEQNYGMRKVLFEPDRSLPALSEDIIGLFARAQMQWLNLGDYKGHTLKLLNLMSDPSTQTTKTFASLVMVGRAIEHIKRTGENIIILVITSGNKGVALRSAVERALVLGLVDRQQLRVVMLTPSSSEDKLRKSLLSEDSDLRRLNPIIIYAGENSTYLKRLGQDLQDKYFYEFFEKYNTRIWYSLNLDNYQVSDSARAFFEYENLLQGNFSSNADLRIHVHAVSSAFGFIGYHLGRSVLVREGITKWSDNPGYFLVQHLKTPDIVLYNYFRSFDRRNLPQYKFDVTTGLYKQEENLHFPTRTFDAEENLDATFYSYNPATSPQISEMIRKFGGGGIVVSLYECLENYSLIRSILSRADFHIVADPRKVTEWSTIMALSGVIQAIDRKIIPNRAELVIHGTGYYARHTDYAPICIDSLPHIDDTTPVEALKGFISG